MPKYNKYLTSLNDKNEFSQIAIKVSKYKKENPTADIISLGIGDVSRPIVKPVIDAMHHAVDDLADMSTFKGYGAYYGYDFLKQAILDNEYKKHKFSLDEIYIYQMEQKQM